MTNKQNGFLRFFLLGCCVPAVAFVAGYGFRELRAIRAQQRYRKMQSEHALQVASEALKCFPPYVPGQLPTPGRVLQFRPRTSNLEVAQTVQQ